MASHRSFVDDGYVFTIKSDPDGDMEVWRHNEFVLHVGGSCQIALEDGQVVVC